MPYSPQAPKPCEHCGKMFAGKSPQQWLCSRPCVYAYRTRGRPPRICIQCGAVIRARPRYRTCSAACSAARKGVHDARRLAARRAKRAMEINRELAGLVEISDDDLDARCIATAPRPVLPRQPIATVAPSRCRRCSGQLLIDQSGQWGPVYRCLMCGEGVELRPATPTGFRERLREAIGL